ncbi:GATA zinc finger domain-containing protein 7 [Drosophila navojoa]|uniref:GATA zinc finger domain-containing protein 7 n=1 Tax=Drosophila navojoa TaxID=7232 RepID=UPI0011BDFE49|nr:GATA zinc finger domain-containing protein 7 [Drosophila navojoa]
MAVFLINICKFNGCFKTFPSLNDLISHIEGTHIDYDPQVVEQKELAPPASLPLSYVLRYISDDARKEPSTFLINNTSSNNNSTSNAGSGNAGNAELKRKLAIKHHSYSMSSSNRSNTPTGSEMDDDEMVVSESEDSNDSWTTEEFSSEFIMRYGSRHSGGGSNGTPGNEKPFACPVPGCKKRYKNVNGIKYHSKNGHKKDGRVRKGYKCHCGKSYKTMQGLKNHALHTHNSQPESVLTTQQLAGLAVAAAASATADNVGRCKTENNNSSNGSSLTGSNNANNNVGLLQRSNSPSQSLGSLSPSSSNMSSSTSASCHGAGSLGSNSLSSNAATASNMLQQLSNGNIVTVTNLPQQQQQQQLSLPRPLVSSSNNSNRLWWQHSRPTCCSRTRSCQTVAATSASGVEPMDTDEAPIVASDALMLTDSSLCSATAAADGKDLMPSTIASAVNSGTITVAAIEVVGAGVVNTETIFCSFFIYLVCLLVFCFMISLLLFLFSLPIAETSYSCSHNNNSNSSNSNSGSSSDSSNQLAAAKFNRPTATAAPAAATTATMPASKPAATTPMQISYTFIEHKYSLGFKEKFFSNLRASRNGTLSGGNGDQLAATAAAIGAESVGTATVAGGTGGSSNANMLGAVAVGQMCALQNEHIHQNLYKKTIN